MDRALSGKMTTASFSLMFSGCFVTLLIWGHTTVVCLVDQHLPEQPATTISIHPTETMELCGNYSKSCTSYCSICTQFFGGPTMECLSQMFHHLCLTNFVNEMASLNSTDWCNWGNVSSSYSNLSRCTEEISDCLLIPWPNRLVEETFVSIHSRYFKDCPSEELSDPPPAIIFALVITPICLIPVMVSLVVLKTKNGDGSS